jgi:hypothetical protein
MDPLYFGNFTECGGGCRKLIVFTDCAALAYDGTIFKAASDPTKDDALSAAFSQVPGSSIVTSACNDGGPPVQ